jgi:predicted ATPase
MTGGGAYEELKFGPFELSSSERVLRRDGLVLPLGSRALDILIYLAERPGEVIAKRELIDHVWSDVNVDEGSLRVHVAAIRKALGDGKFGNRYIANIQGRGYSFVGAVVGIGAVRDRDQERGTLPARPRRMVGRDAVLSEVRDSLRAKRFVTLLGPGGIGKTTIAVAAGHAVCDAFGGEVYFVDLGSLADPRHVVRAIGTSLGVVLRSNDASMELVNFVRSRKLLIILDSCEHVIEAVALVAELLFQGAEQVHLLVTSRELLRVEGEYCYRVSPLDFPPCDSEQTADAVIRYPAAQLLVERVTARGSNFVLTDREAPFVADMCRRLDGLPLAIELAAGPTAALGVRSTVARLVSRLELLKLGHRTAVLRHQSLKATLDWSYDLLSNAERIVFRRVARLVGHFSLEGARYVAWEQSFVDTEIFDAIAGLVEKSLLATWLDEVEPQYRLLDTTRAYALEKLDEHAEFDAISLRHAEYVAGYLESQRELLSCLPDGERVAAYSRQLGNVRSALEWSFGAHGDVRIAVRLAAAAAQMFVGMLLLTECRHWMEKAIDWMTADTDPRHQMDVHGALALSLMFTEGNSERVRNTFQTALIFAERCEDADQQMRLLSGLSMYSHRIVDPVETLQLALRGTSIAKRTGNPHDAAIADSMLGAAYCLHCDQVRAQQHLRQSLSSFPGTRTFNASQYLFDMRTFSLSVLVHSLFFSGNLDEANRYASMNIEEAETAGHPIGICRALMHPMRLWFWIDDMAQAEKSLLKLEHLAERHSLAPFRAVALALRGRYLIRFDRINQGMHHLQDGLEHLTAQRYEVLLVDFVFELVVCLAKRGKHAEALALADQWIAAQVRIGRPLHLPLLFLAKGLALSYGDRDVRSAEEYFEKAITQSRQELALPFELRAALVLARLWIGRGELQRARDLVAPIYTRFSEGFTTPDLIVANRILKDGAGLTNILNVRR